jgi:hypothetical protein
MLFGSRNDGNGHRRPSGRIRHVLGQCLGATGGDVFQHGRPVALLHFFREIPRLIFVAEGDGALAGMDCCHFSQSLDK